MIVMRISRLTVVFFLILLALALPIMLQASDHPDKIEWTSDDDMLLYFEVFVQIKKNALSQPSGREIVHESLKKYLQSIDPYADFLKPDEYEAFKRSQKSNYIGIGMRIDRDAAGHIICIPFPGSPAETAGVAQGDILKAIDGIDIARHSLFGIGTLIGGKQGTRVVMILQTPAGALKTVSVKRENVFSDSVQEHKIDRLTVIKIFFFRNSTQRELKYLITNRKTSKPLVIDLRGNSGGDLNSAIDCAMLFLARDKKIVEIKKSSSVKSYLSFGNTADPTLPLYIWQDEKTASAAEVFSAALTQNGRALSVGRQTYGKGVTQDIIKLSDGSAMFLTTGYLYTPNGERYHKKGLKPDYRLNQAAPETDHFVSQTKRLIRRKSVPEGQALPHGQETDERTPQYTVQ